MPRPSPPALAPPTSLLVALLAAFVPAAGALAQERPSLEELLREARRRRAEIQERMTAEVEDAVLRLEELAGRDKLAELRTEQQRERLLALGLSAAPALVPYVDPGPTAPVAAAHRARVVAGVLRELASPAVTDELLALVRDGSPEARRNALGVLETTPEPDRVIPTVRALFREERGPVREAALATLGRLGGAEALAALREALEDEDAELVGIALRTLGLVPGEEVEELVLDHLARSDAERHLGALRAFYATRPPLLAEDDAHLEAVVRLLARPFAPRSDVVAFLGFLAEVDAQPRLSARRTLEPLAEHANDEVREGALVLMARARDKGARRDFLAPYDRKVERQDDYYGVYSERGGAYYRLAEYPAAVKDYKEAIRLQNLRRPDPDPYIGIARCYARMGRFKDAADYLGSAPTSIATLQALASEPAFREMAESRYRTAFQLPK